MHPHRFAFAHIRLRDVRSHIAALIEERRPVRGIVLIAIIEGDRFPAVADQALHGKAGRLGDFCFQGALHRPPPGPGTIVADWPSSARRQVRASPTSNASRLAIIMIAIRFASWGVAATWTSSTSSPLERVRRRSPWGLLMWTGIRRLPAVRAGGARCSRLRCCRPPAGSRRAGAPGA